MKVFTACGKHFSSDDLQTIRSIIAAQDRPNRAEISRRVCRILRWVRSDGHLKDMSCRVALLRMHRDNLITLPPPTNKNGNGRCGKTISSRSNPENPITEGPGRLKELHLKVIAKKAHSSLWNEYIQRYHYLGYQPLPGAQIRYFIVAQDRILGALGFGAAAWKTVPGDQWIRWNTKQREIGLRLFFTHLNKYR